VLAIVFMFYFMDVRMADPFFAHGTTGKISEGKAFIRMIFIPQNYQFC